MFNSTLMDFDLGLLGSQTLVEQSFTSEPYGAYKTYVQHMEEDKKVALTTDPNIEWLEETSDLKAFMDIGALPEVNDENVDCDALIDEVETFLQKHEAPNKQHIESNNFGSMENDNLLHFSQEEMDAAENLLDELLRSNDVNLNLEGNEEEAQKDTKAEPEIETTTQESCETEFKIQSQNDSGFFEMSNVTEVITEDGRQIVIMIAPPSPSPSKMSEDDDVTTEYIVPESVATVESEHAYIAAPESVVTVESDSEWDPDSPRSSKGRPMVKRNYSSKKQKRSTSGPYITDKKERKKLQNVEAARRYR